MDLTVLFQLSYGVYAVSAWDTDQARPSGCIVNSIMQVTAEPPTVALSVHHDNYTNQLIRKAGRCAVTILRESEDPAVIGRLGFQSGRDIAKFEGLDWQEENGLPVLSSGSGCITGTVIDQMETPTHTVFLISVESTRKLQDGVPMTYDYYHRVVKGKAPKNAPTYQASEPEQEQITEQAAAPAVWVCSICGYVYDEETPFEQLPEDWVCPLCRQPKSVFRKQG